MGNKNKKQTKIWWKNIPDSVKIAFICCFAAGFFAHVFAFTNIIPNSDGVSRVFDAQQMTVSGRWFLHFATAWNGYVQAPAVIGFFSLLFLSLSAALTDYLLRIKSRVISGLCGALMSVFPSVAYTFMYMFTASAYFFGMLLAVIAVYLVSRFRYGFLLAAIPLALSVGTYQAYLAVAASLSLILVILFGLEGKRSAKDIFRLGLKYLVFLVLGLLLYFGILKLFLAAKKLALLDYKGISALGSDITVKGVVSLILLTYKNFVKYFFTSSFAKYTTVIAVIANSVFLLVGAYAFVILVRKNRCYKKPGAFILTLCLCVLLPLALNLTVMMGEAMPIMRYALVFTYILALVFVDRATDKENIDKKKVLSPALLRPAAAVVSLLILIVSFNIDNLAYTVSAQAHRSTLSFATRLVDRVETTPGYQNGMEVVVIGGFPRSVYYNDIEAFDLVQDYSNYSTSVIPRNKHVYYYLNDWLNVRWAEPAEDLMIEISDSAEFQAMPLYPSDGSIKIIDGRVVVKLAARYTPKQPYEIQYENRR